MRVIAGSARGIRLTAIPPGVQVRPTLDRVREALFSILMPRLHDAHFLDLFAGTGANGIEAISRGAAEAVFVEGDPRVVALIRQNLAKTRLHERGRCLHLPLPEEMGRIPRPEMGFGIVYGDPPHAFGKYEVLLEALVRSGLLATESIVVLEHAAKDELPAAVEGLERSRVARYGSTALSFYA